MSEATTTYRWTVLLYKRGDKLKPVKRWQEYLSLEHDQYGGYCRHYRIPENLVDEALAAGARHMVATWSCGKGE